MFWSVFVRYDAASTTEIYTLSLHDALPIYFDPREAGINERVHYPVFKEILDRELKGEELKEALRENLDALDRKSTRLNSSHVKISYAVFCLKKKKKYATKRQKNRKNK